MTDETEQILRRLIWVRLPNGDCHKFKEPSESEELDEDGKPLVRGILACGLEPAKLLVNSNRLLPFPHKSDMCETCAVYDDVWSQIIDKVEKQYEQV